MSKNNIKNTETNEVDLSLLMGGNPGAIENQEARGQQELVNSSQLPRKNNTYARKGDIQDIYKSMGIKVVTESNGDDLFFDVELPKNWKLESTDHSMWNNLLDDKGRTRATIFYKAAFYDRDAFININTRYFCGSQYTEKESPDERFHPKFYCVKDTVNDEILFKTEITKEYSDDALEAQAEKWIADNFPKHEDITAYWD